MLILSPRVAVGILAAALAFDTPARSADPAAIRWRTDYAAARKEAQEKGLPLLLDIGTVDCTHCRRQEATTFRDPGIIEMLNTHFIPLQLDGNKERPLVQAMRVQMYPTTVLAAPDGKVVGFMQGYVSADQLREQLRRAMPAPTPAQEPWPRRARLLIADAKDDLRAGRHADCLDKCDLVVSRSAGQPEAREAEALAAQVTADPERMAVACEQLAGRTAARYLTLADSLVKQGQSDKAAAYLEKVVRLDAGGKYGGQAEARLTGMKRNNISASPASRDP